jgi:hypothetical protein
MEDTARTYVRRGKFSIFSNTEAISSPLLDFFVFFVKTEKINELSTNMETLRLSP